VNFFGTSIANIRSFGGSNANLFDKAATVPVTFSTGTALFFAWNLAFTDISKLTVPAISTVVEIDIIIPRNKSTVFSNFFGYGRGIFAYVLSDFLKRHVII